MAMCRGRGKNRTGMLRTIALKHPAQASDHVSFLKADESLRCECDKQAAAPRVTSTGITPSGPRRTSRSDSEIELELL